MMKCSKCGGTLQHGLCLLCEMFDSMSPPGGTCTGWPMESMSMAVCPEQALEANEFLRDSGISSREAYHKPDGKLVLESAKAKKKVIAAKNKAMGTDMLKDLSSFN